MDTRPAARRVARKELGIFFASPAAWLFLGTFAGVSLFAVFWVESFFARNVADARPLFQWMPLLLVFLCSALSMRSWSEERRSGTLEHLLVQPTPLWRIVLGKFYACLALLSLALVCTLPLPVTVALVANLDWGPVFAGYLASILLGAAYLSIGMWVSARTDNSIVALIGSVTLCGLFYLVGSDLFTNFFPSAQAELLRELGSGSRFDSITRGVIDIRDLFYYLSLCCAFLGLTIYRLEREGWARFATTPRQRHWRVGIVLVLANLLVANLWLAKVPGLRQDITEGRIYSLSDTSRELLGQLREPLLIRGYFSARNHSLLAPLEPQLKDLIEEYATAAHGNVRVEFVDPAGNPELEQEALQRFGMHPTPIQVADRHQTSLVNAWFHVLVEYATEFRVLGFSDLIEVRTATNGRPEVLLRNPEFDITSAIRDVMHDYRSGGDLFAGIQDPVEFIGYISADGKLPQRLRDYRDVIEKTLADAVAASAGKLSFRLLQPEDGDGALAQKLEQDWGFTPLHDPDTDTPFFFYLTLADSRQVVRLPGEGFDPANFRLVLDAGLRRFAHGFTRSVALVAPRTRPELARLNLGGPGFARLREAISRDYTLIEERLDDGSVSPEADVLVLAAPENLDEVAVYAVDQFLMRGGTVILATSPWTVTPGEQGLELHGYNSGLRDWLAHNGVGIGKGLVMDSRQARFPAPVQRAQSDSAADNLKIIDYPFFVDVRDDGLSEHPISRNLPHVTVAWPSPLEVQHLPQRRVTPLLFSSADAGVSQQPEVAARENSSWQIPEPRARQVLGVSIHGVFDSAFQAPPLALARHIDGRLPQAFVRRSPESARLIVYPSNDIFSDRVLSALVQATGTQYLGPIALFSNTLDWALRDQRFLPIRARAHFNRTLPPMTEKMRLGLELFNYGAALGWLLLLALLGWLLRRHRRTWLRRELGL
ncbi:Gldg family protein [Haliea sp. E17]|uniref:Gldg family protein n=1 Tax=Haliea sp. E17 TaxID=3401576 RepID=UPI003AAE8542